MPTHPQRDGPKPGNAPAARARGSATADPRARPLAPANVHDRVRGQTIQGALKRLLDQVPGSRRALPHLAALEDGLGRRGASAAEQVPPHWLGRIVNQLGSLPLREDDHELQDLLSRLSRALAEHQRPPQDLPVLTEVYAPGSGGATTGADAPPAPAARPAWADAAPMYADHPALRAPADRAPSIVPPAQPPMPSPAEPLDEDGLPRFTTMPKASELDLEPEVFQTFFGDCLRPPERSARLD